MGVMDHIYKTVAASNTKLSFRLGKRAWGRLTRELQMTMEVSDLHGPPKLVYGSPVTQDAALAPDDIVADG